ncbi:flagellar biosynthetic protein FliO [Massilia sp. PWRC2]|uniref:flagellar biosynthetic protein FliO n=1 Tax=Massilia sp. PWRC2 TaxID=2804626 RepID=UPI003CF4E605
MRGRRILAGALAALLLAGAVHAQQPAAAGAAAALPAPSSAAAALPAASAASAALTVLPKPAPAAAPVQPFAGAAAGSLLQTIFALCVVLGLLALLAWAMKRYGPRTAGGSAPVRLVGGLSLGGRERIVVVEVGDQWIVVGASPGRVNALATMPRQAEGAAGPLPAAGTSSFADWLKQTIDQRNTK